VALPSFVTLPGLPSAHMHRFLQHLAQMGRIAKVTPESVYFQILFDPLPTEIQS